MKVELKPPAQPGSMPLNEIGLLAWSLMADSQLNMVGGGIPGQPAPDTPNEYPQPEEPGEPTIPDEPPPTPVA